MRLRFEPIDLGRDGDRCVAFREDAYTLSYGDADRFHGSDGLGAVRYLEKMRQRCERYPGSCVHAWEGDRIVGQIELTRLTDAWDTGHVAFYYLVPEVRGRGYGPQLDAYALRYFTQVGCSAVQLGVARSNTRAIRFYQLHGWVEEGSFDGYGNVERMVHALPAH